LDKWPHDLPRSHDWIHDTGESLGDRIAGATEEEAGRQFAHAVMRDAAAYAHMQVWKSYEFVSGATILLNLEHILAAATCARAALEAAASLTVIATRQRNAIISNHADPVKTMEALRRLSERLDRAMFGGKRDELNLKSINALSNFDEITKQSQDEEVRTDLRPTYELLCEMIHPSTFGNQIYWGKAITESEHGQHLFPLHINAHTPAMGKLSLLCLWSLGWSSYWSIKSFNDVTELARELQRY